MFGVNVCIVEKFIIFKQNCFWQNNKVFVYRLIDFKVRVDEGIKRKVKVLIEI